MATETKLTFPAIPISHFWTLRTQFKKSIPSTISQNYIASTLNMDEKSAKANILPSLRMIGLIDIDGKVNNELVKKLRDDEQYPIFCKDVLSEVYPKELLEAFPDINSDKSGVKRWFMNHTGVGENGAGKFVAFYMTLLEGDPNKANETKLKSNSAPKPISKERKIVSQKTVEQVIEQPEIPTIELQPKIAINQNSPEVHVNIQVHIASDATAEQIDKIFESMGKHLFNKS